MVFALVSPLLVFTFAIFSVACLRLERTTGRLAATFVLAYGHIVVASRVTGTLYLLSDKLAWVVVQALLTGSAIILWWYLNRPSITIVHLSTMKRVWLFPWFKWQNLLLIGLVGATSAAYLVLAGLVLYVPPNNWDGMTYRLPRIMYWLQFNSFYPHLTVDARITTFPHNAEIGILWTFLLAGTDYLAGFVQWLSAIVAAVVIFDLTRIIGGTSRQGVIAAAIWMSFPLILAESTSIQNDLVVSVFLLIGVYALYYGIIQSRSNALLLSGLSIGLAIGTKSTIFFMLPGLALAALIIWLVEPRRLLKPMVSWAVYSIIGFILFGAYSYAVNVAAFDDPLGQPEQYNSLGVMNHSLTSVDSLLLNLPRYTYQMIDLSNMPRRQILNEKKRQWVEQVFGDARWVTEGPFIPQVGTYVNEDIVWFGVLGVIVLLPGLGYGLFRGLRQRNVYVLGLVIMALMFTILHSAIQPWTPFKGRYYVLVSIVAAPLMMWVALTRHFIMTLVRWGVVLMAIVSLAIILRDNTQKPLGRARYILTADHDRISMFALTRPPVEDMFRAFEAEVPPDATIRVARLRGSTWLYPYWGERLDRTLVPVPVTQVAYTSLEEIAQANPVFLVGSPPDTEYPASDFIIVDHLVMDRLTDFSGFEQVASLADLEFFFRRIRD